MRIPLRFHSVSHAAPSSDALTMREWESLARAFGELEAEGVSIWYSLPRPEEVSTLDIVAQVDAINASVVGWVNEHLVRVGLDAREWVVFARPGRMNLIPAIARKWAWHEMTWLVDVQLLPERSAAKSAAMDTHYAPTLAEQYGAARK